MKALVISVHPDDETLGCGGTLLKHRSQGTELFWLIMTKAYEPRWSAETIERKTREIEQVAAAYRMNKVFRTDFPSARLDTVPVSDLIEAVVDVALQVKPELLYLVHSGDVHTDHQLVHTATISAIKSFTMTRFNIRRILSYEVISSTEAAPPGANRSFIPNVFNEITPLIDQKITIMDHYETEAQPDPFPRGPSAIRALARYRGATVAVDYAEAFMLLRELM